MARRIRNISFAGAGRKAADREETEQMDGGWYV